MSKAINPDSIRFTKKRTITYSIIITLVMALTAVLFYYMFYLYVLGKAEENVTNLLLFHKGIHHYVQKVLIPSYYEYQSEEKIPTGFYAPELLSSSFIVREQHAFYNQERQNSGYTELYYKMAANNPRNPVNRADDLERDLIKMFNEHPEIKSYRKITEINDKKVLYVAIPFLKNDTQCLKCHGKREDAPPDLQKRYQGQGGFNEKIDEIRAITSIRSPMEHEYMHIYVAALTIFAGFFAFVILFFFNARLRTLVDRKTISLEHEIDEHKHTEQILDQNRSMLDQILNTTPQAIFWKDLNGRYIGCNNVFANDVGLKHPDQITDKTDYDLPWPKDEAEAYRADDLEVIESCKPKLHIVEPLQQADGSRLWIKTSKVPLVDKDGKVFGVLGVYEDISDRKRAEEELKIKENAIETSINGIALADLNGKITYVNKSFMSLWGYDSKDEIIGKMFPDFWQAKEEALVLINRLKNEGQWLGEMIARKKGGETFIAQVSSGMIKNREGIPLCIMASYLDVSERHKYEDQIRQAQRLEAMGTLAGGIAHDFNNILSPIIGYAEIVQDEFKKGSEPWQNQQAILDAGFRARDLVGQILAFARQAEHERKPVQISNIIREVLKLLRSSLPTTIEIRQNIEEASGLVNADPTQIHQIIMNLCTNAFHAMESTGGVLEISLTSVNVNSNDYRVNNQLLTQGQYLLLDITDTGCGMDQMIVNRIFEPYFTTKEKGKGTGLGLSVVHGIVKSCGGHIAVFSEPGKGTKFRIYLPQSMSDIQDALPENKEVLPTGNERVLIIDDEAAVAKMEGKMLEIQGYETITLTSSIEALALLRREPGTFDLVITDMTMPEMTGFELARKYLSIRPGAKVILCTGFSDLVNEEKAKAEGIAAFLMKPVARKELATAVRTVLDK
jgi:PAS domain S-box-containing protein